MKGMVLITAVFLCGCSIFNPYHEDFLCQGQTTVGKCQDMGQAYTDAQHTDNRLVIEDPKPTDHSLSESEKKYVSAVFESQAQRVQDSATPLVQRPRLLRMLMLDYTDHDVLFGSRYIWFLNDRPKWVVPSASTGRP